MNKPWLKPELSEQQCTHHQHLAQQRRDRPEAQQQCELNQKRKGKFHQVQQYHKWRF